MNELDKLLLLTTRALVVRANKKIENAESLSQLFLLELLLDGEKKVSDIANGLEITPSAVTGLTNKMIKKGLIERKYTEEDRRVVYLKITKEGRGRYEEVSEEKLRGMERFHSQFSQEERKLLEKIYLKILKGEKS